MSMADSIREKSSFWRDVWYHLRHPYGPPTLDPNAVFTQRVLKIFADARIHDELLWMVDDNGKVTFMANVSDTFDWGSADGETIVPRYLGELEKAYADLKDLENRDGVSFPTTYTKYTAMLYAARRRGERPKAWAYPSEAPVAALLDACGGAQG